MSNEAPIDLILVRLRAFDDRLRALETRVEELHGQLGQVRPASSLDRRPSDRKAAAEALSDHLARIEQRLWSAGG